ncbi:hypothetical protein JI739_00370 [Ramlibacter sp. AW1]|uniref:Uncharacterized protein n=1 Tax=Ramlibacter aurantiacus TaxID=2801330 RepID=A0A936ZF77_9BURK|nr:hypothetical protein [Ramlibacter aurantiacus]MBL0418787.1 hypothetical protein [Ramlibacter aurantiacus]
MRWFKPNLKSSIYALLGHGPAASAIEMDTAMDQIRRAMLGLLGSDGIERHPLLARRLRYATDIQGLWYARNDLMAALAAVHGELKARQAVEEVTLLFRGLLPEGLYGRSSRPPAGDR